MNVSRSGGYRIQNSPNGQGKTATLREPFLDSTKPLLLLLVLHIPIFHDHSIFECLQNVKHVVLAIPVPNVISNEDLTSDSADGADFGDLGLTDIVTMYD
jgi:hypothetical protein